MAGYDSKYHILGDFAMFAVDVVPQVWLESVKNLHVTLEYGCYYARARIQTRKIFTQ